jgi:hypothetical protein
VKGAAYGAAPRSARGNLDRSARTHVGAYVDNAFLNAPNQIRTRRTPADRAPFSRSSTTPKSNRPSSGSTWSQPTEATTELTPERPRLSQIGSMWIASDELELCSSPPRHKNGLPSTINRT